MKLRTSETLFFITGLIMLCSVWFVENELAEMIWRSSKIFYFTGIVFFVADFLKDKKQA